MKKQSATSCSAIKVALIAAVLSMCCACDVKPKYARFIDLPDAQAEDEFRKLPIPEQIDVYLYLSTKIDPPKMAYADLVAANGRAAVPAVLHGLSKEPTDAGKMRLILILESMARLGRYNVHEDPGVIRAVEESIRPMTNDFDRQMATKSLDEIRRVYARSTR